MSWSALSLCTGKLSLTHRLPTSACRQTPRGFLRPERQNVSFLPSYSFFSARTVPTFILPSSLSVCQRQPFLRATSSMYESWRLFSDLTTLWHLAQSDIPFPHPAPICLSFLIARFFLSISILYFFLDGGVLRSTGLAISLLFGSGSSHLCLHGFGVSMGVSTMSVLSSALTDAALVVLPTPQHITDGASSPEERCHLAILSFSRVILSSSPATSVTVWEPPSRLCPYLPISFAIWFAPQRKSSANFLLLLTLCPVVQVFESNVAAAAHVLQKPSLIPGYLVIARALHAGSSQ